MSIYSRWQRRLIAWGQRMRIRMPLTSWTTIKASYRFAQMIEMVRVLRGPEGCPWDRRQTIDDMLPYLREETLEVLVAGHQATQQGDSQPLCEELGDLQFVALFVARLFEEQGQFDIADALGSIVAKMLRRHPHVFSDSPRDQDSIRKTWQVIKAQEKQQKASSKANGARTNGAASSGVSAVPASDVAAKKPFSSILDDVYTSMSALHDALGISRKVVKVGFEWPDVWDVWAKMLEEVEELKEVMPPDKRANANQTHATEHSVGSSGTKATDAPLSDAMRKQRQREELGDLLFTIVNLGRHLGIDSEEALRNTCLRFVRRFRHIEESLYARGKTLEETPLDDLELLWQEAKRLEPKPQERD